MMLNGLLSFPTIATSMKKNKALISPPGDGYGCGSGAAGLHIDVESFVRGYHRILGKGLK